MGWGEDSSRVMHQGRPGSFFVCECVDAGLTDGGGTGSAGVASAVETAQGRAGTLGHLQL